MEPLEDVRVRYFEKQRGRKDLVPSCDARVAAHITTNSVVAGLVSVASDYVYDETKHGPILKSLLHGVNVATHEKETTSELNDAGEEDSSRSERSSREGDSESMSSNMLDADDILAELDYDPDRVSVGDYSN
jgi:hypothetical protein